jgi:branched-chain amino acid transport system permease protein
VEKKLLYTHQLSFFKVWHLVFWLQRIIPTIVAGLIGYAILGLRGHYFAICTLGLGVAAGEISGGN